MPVSPIEHLTGIVPVEAGVGTSAVAMPASDWFSSGAGFYLGGVLALLADAPLGAAIITGLPQGTALTTQELTLHFLRPAGPDSRRLTARGQIIHGGRAIGLSEVNIQDAEGRLLAYGSSRCVTLRVPVPDSAPARPAEQIPPTWVPPIERPVQGALTPADDFASRSGRELLDGWTDGSLPLPPVCHLFGMHPQGGADGVAMADMPASGWLMNPAGTVYGGALAMMADAAISFAATTILPVGHSFTTLDLKVNFLRPVRPDGQTLTAEGRIIHAGKRMLVASGEVLDAQGRQVVVATGSQMLVPAHVGS